MNMELSVINDINSLLFFERNSAKFLKKFKTHTDYSSTPKTEIISRFYGHRNLGKPYQKNNFLKQINEREVPLNKEPVRKHCYVINERIKGLKDFPETGRIVPEFPDDFYAKYRELLYENYRIIYKNTESEIVIVRIIDCRRLLKMGMPD